MNDRFEIFITSINKLYKSLSRIKNLEMSELNLRGTHVMCIFELGKHPEGLTITKLSMLCGEDKAHISRIMSELVRRNYITADGSKKYRQPYYLTDSGKEICNRINQMVFNAVNAGSANMTEDERIHFYNTLSDISNNLQEYIDYLDTDFNTKERN